MIDFLTGTILIALSIAAIAYAWQAVCLVLGIGEEKRQAARERIVREELAKLGASMAAGALPTAPSPAETLGAKVNPLFAACLAPVMAGKPLQLCKVEAITPHGMGSYVIGVFDAAVFARVLEPVLEKEFPSP